MKLGWLITGAMLLIAVAGEHAWNDGNPSQGEDSMDDSGEDWGLLEQELDELERTLEETQEPASHERFLRRRRLPTCTQKKEACNNSKECCRGLICRGKAGRDRVLGRHCLKCLKKGKRCCDRGDCCEGLRCARGTCVAEKQ